MQQHKDKTPLPHAQTLEGHNTLPPTKDPYYVQHFLGHKSLKNTEVYINIEHAMFQTGGPDEKWTVKVTDKPDEIVQLLADGFEEATHQGNLIFLRKRK